MNTIEKIIDELGGHNQAAIYLGMAPPNLSKYKKRGYLPLHYWEKVNDLDLGITYERFISEYAASRGGRHSPELPGL